MDAPRILAINDVHLPAPGAEVERLVGFYGGLIGLERIDAGLGPELLVFRGYPRSGPRLIVGLDDRSLERALRRRVLIQVGCLSQCAEQLLENGASLEWTHGWTYFDQRLITFDPAGNRVDLLTSHVI